MSVFSLGLPGCVHILYFKPCIIFFFWHTNVSWKVHDNIRPLWNTFSPHCLLGETVSFNINQISTWTRYTNDNIFLVHTSIHIYFFILLFFFRETFHKIDTFNLLEVTIAPFDKLWVLWISKLHSLILVKRTERKRQKKKPTRHQELTLGTNLEGKEGFGKRTISWLRSSGPPLRRWLLTKQNRIEKEEGRDGGMRGTQ